MAVNASIRSLGYGQALSGRIVLAALSFGIDPYVQERMAVVLVIGKAYLLKGVLVDAVHTRWLSG